MASSFLKVPNSAVAGALLGVCGMTVMVLILWFEGRNRFFSPSDLPTPSPEESRRIVHSAGFSVICPIGWSSRVIAIPEDNDNSIELRSRNLTPTRRIYGSFFGVSSRANVVHGNPTTVATLPGG